MNKESLAAQFVVAINFDIDSLASVIAEQHDDTVIDLILLISRVKNSQAFDEKISSLQLD